MLGIKLKLYASFYDFVFQNFLEDKYNYASWILNFKVFRLLEKEKNIVKVGD